MRYAYLATVVCLLALLGACAPGGVPVTGFNPDPAAGRAELVKLAENAEAAVKMAEATDDQIARQCLAYVSVQLRALAEVPEVEPGPFTAFMQVRGTRRMLTNQGDGMVMNCAALKEDIRRAWIGIGATLSGILF